MTDIETVKALLEALEESEPLHSGVGWRKKHGKAKQAGRALLSQMQRTPQAEPLLSDEEIVALAREAAKGSAINRAGTTSVRIGRAIERAVLSRIGKQQESEK